MSYINDIKFEEVGPVLAQHVAEDGLSRQRKWQLERMAKGKCESCGKKRGKGREKFTRCKSCERNRYLKKKAARKAKRQLKLKQLKQEKK